MSAGDRPRVEHSTLCLAGSVGCFPLTPADPLTGGPVIFIAAKFQVLPEHADSWPEITREFSTATRGEAGCLWFDWSRSLDDPNEYVLVEAFRDDAAGAAHVQSDHFKKAQQDLPSRLAETPRIVNFTIPQDDWSELGELAVPDRGRRGPRASARNPGTPGSE